MTLFKPTFRPGINLVDSSLQNEGGFIASDRVRFHRGLPQVLGGWSLASVTRFEGVARGCRAWRTLEGKKVFAFGTNSHLYAMIGGDMRDITPSLHDTVLTDVFTTENGSKEVTVSLPYHRLRIGNEVTFSNHQSTVGGLTIDGTYTVQSIPTEGLFTIEATTAATSNVTTPSGSNIDFKVPLPPGDVDTPSSGYGSGPYGAGPYGSSGEVLDELRAWTLDNWGEFLLANPSGYGIFEYQPESRYEELAYNGNFANAKGWALGTDWTIGSNKATKTAGSASNLSQNVEGVMEPGRYYRVSFTVTVTAGSAGNGLKLRMNAGLTPTVIDVGDASKEIYKVGTYTISRLVLCPADVKDIVFEAKGSFAGSISNVSYKLMDRAYRIQTAPPRVDAMFIDPRGLVVALGTLSSKGQYSATLARCSDLGNNRAWVPDDGSYASEIPLRGGGGRLMAGLATRQQNLVWGDGGVFSFQWKGEFGDAFRSELLGTSCGLISRHAMCEQNGFVMWMTNTRQFRMFKGVGATSLGVPEIMPCAIREDVFDNLDGRQVLKIHAGINAAFSEAWFFYPDSRDGDECSRVAVCSWAEASQDAGVPWVTHKIARTAWEGQGILDNPYGLTPDGLIMEHEVGYTANGEALNEYLETADFDIEEGQKLLRIRGLMPDFAGQTGNIQIEFMTRNYPNGPEIRKPPLVATPSSLKLNTHVMGRQARVRLTGLTAGAFWRFGAIRLDIQKSGADR